MGVLKSRLSNTLLTFFVACFFYWSIFSLVVLFPTCFTMKYFLAAVIHMLCEKRARMVGTSLVQVQVKAKLRSTDSKDSHEHYTKKMAEPSHKGL
jgi:hypothetical protein